jgi:hypothetical protein
MLVFLSMLAAGLLLFSIIVLLHKMQQQQKVDSVDRTIPLPPLNVTDKQRVLAISDASAIELPAGLPAEKETIRYLPEILACDEGDCPVLPDWQARSKIYAAANDFPRALMSCARAFPLMGAFRQACLLLRGRIREQRKVGDDWSRNLEVLYRIAVWADLLHGKWEGHTPPSAAQIKGLDMLKLEDIPFDYAQIGYKELALLNTTDWKLLVECWGEPSAHHHACDLHSNALQALLNKPKQL